MKLQVEIANQSCQLNLRRSGSRVIAELDGRSYEVELRELGQEQYLLIEGTRVHECRVEKSCDQREGLEVSVGTRRFAVKIIDPKRLRSAHSSGAHDHGSAAIVAPMPGKVVRVLVNVGSRVEAGDGVIVVEAMKMQNEMKSPKTGMVISLHSAAGATVNAGDVLAIID